MSRSKKAAQHLLFKDSTAKKRQLKQTGDAESHDEPSPKRSRVALPEGVHHYQTLEEVPEDIQKYWHQGYSIFSRYDEGIWMTDDAWYGVTHESVANKISQHIAAAAPRDKSIIVDAFCGVGGNTIAFALSGRWKRVYAIEKDAATLACAKHNAEIYGVADQITWFQGDCFEILDTHDEQKANAVPALKAIISQFGIIFASPPWGGPSYGDASVFDLNRMEPYTLNYIQKHFKQVTSNIVLYLPRTSNLQQIADNVDEEGKVQTIHYCTNGTSRALCTYLGRWEQVE